MTAMCRERAALLVCTAMFVIACGGGATANRDAGASVEACFEDWVEGNSSMMPGCFDCVKASCSSQLDAFETACASLFSCACASGAFEENAYIRCGDEGLDETSDCIDADSAEVPVHDLCCIVRYRRG